VNYSPDYQKPTPLDLAILKGDIELVKLLLAAGKGLKLLYGICGCHGKVFVFLSFSL
jgi:ankyrin repeat protein